MSKPQRRLYLATLGLTSLAMGAILGISKVVGQYILGKPVKQEIAIDHYAKARTFESNGQFDSAIGEYLLAINTGRTAPVQAYNNLANLYFRQGRVWDAVRAIDDGIGLAEQNGDPALVQLRASRRDILKQVGPYLKSDSFPQLKDYVCEHDYYVIGASTVQQVAEVERQRVLADFPLAEIGDIANEPTPGTQYVPILVDFFLTCKEAEAVLERVQNKYKSGPFVGRWYLICPPCPGLPGKITRPSPSH